MKAGIWFYVVGLLALVFNGFGALDYVMTMAGNEEYLAQYTEEQLAYWEGLPGWRMVVWTVGIGAGVLGTLTYWLRRAVTVPIWLVAPVAIAVNAVADLTMGGLEVMGVGSIVIGALVLGGVQLLFVFAAGHFARRGILR